MGEDCSDLHMVEPKGFWSNYMIHSLQNGKLKEVWIDEEFKKNNLVEFQMQAQPGDEIQAFTGSNQTLGTMILTFASQEEMLEKMDHMEKCDWSSDVCSSDLNWCQNKGIFSLPKDKFEKVEFP